MSEQALEASLPARRAAPVLQLSFGMRLQKIGLNTTLLAGLVLFTVVVVAAVAAPLLTPYDPIAQKLDEALKPPFVLVGFDDGDLTVRDAEGGRFLAGAAVSYDHLAVAGYWTAGCAPV